MNVLSDNVEKELKYNQCLFTSSIDSLPSKRTVLFQRNRHPKFGDTWETILMAPLQSVFCASTTQPKVTPTNHHWNAGGSITSLSSPFLPSSTRWYSQCQGNVVTPKRAKLNHEKVEDLVVVKCNLRLLDHGLQKVNCNLLD